MQRYTRNVTNKYYNYYRKCYSKEKLEEKSKLGITFFIGLT